MVSWDALGQMYPGQSGQMPAGQGGGQAATGGYPYPGAAWSPYNQQQRQAPTGPGYPGQTDWYNPAKMGPQNQGFQGPPQGGFQTAPGGGPGGGYNPAQVPQMPYPGGQPQMMNQVRQPGPFGMPYPGASQNLWGGQRPQALNPWGYQPPRQSNPWGVGGYATAPGGGSIGGYDPRFGPQNG